MRKILLISTLILLTSCLSTSNQFRTIFSTENIMKLKTHMSSDEIIEMFGEPEDVRSTTCGKTKKWSCTF